MSVASELSLAGWKIRGGRGVEGKKKTAIDVDAKWLLVRLQYHVPKAVESSNSPSAQLFCVDTPPTIFSGMPWGALKVWHRPWGEDNLLNCQFYGYAACIFMGTLYLLANAPVPIYDYSHGF